VNGRDLQSKILQLTPQYAPYVSGSLPPSRCVGANNAKDSVKIAVPVLEAAPQTAPIAKARCPCRHSSSEAPAFASSKSMLGDSDRAGQQHHSGVGEDHRPILDDDPVDDPERARRNEQREHPE